MKIPVSLRRALALAADLLALWVLLFALPARAGLQLHWPAILLCAFLYFCALESSPLEGTLGKRLMGLRVRDGHGRRLTFRRAAVRNLAKMVDVLGRAGAYVHAEYDEHKQMLHDFLSRSRVGHHMGAGAPPEPDRPGRTLKSWAAYILLSPYLITALAVFAVAAPEYSRHRDYAAARAVLEMVRESVHRQQINEARGHPARDWQDMDRAHKECAVSLSNPSVLDCYASTYYLLQNGVMGAGRTHEGYAFRFVQNYDGSQAHCLVGPSLEHGFCSRFGLPTTLVSAE